MIPLLAFTVMFTLLFALYSKWQFEHAKYGYYSQDPRAVHASDRWHLYGLCMRACAVSYAAITIWFPPTLQDVLLAACIGAALWDVFINLIALKKPWHYVGSRDNDSNFEWDNVGDKKWYLYGILIIVAIFIKVFT